MELDFILPFKWIAQRFIAFSGLTHIIMPICVKINILRKFHPQEKLKKLP